MYIGFTISKILTFKNLNEHKLCVHVFTNIVNKTKPGSEVHHAL